MSKFKFKKFNFILMIAMFAFIVFGCGDKEIKVNSVSFSFKEEEQVIMYVGQTLELGEHIEVSPADATNQEYLLTSLDGSVISVEGSKLNALKQGSTFIKVTSLENETLQDVIKISVEEEQTGLAAPKRLNYNHITQTITFGTVDHASSYTLRINGTEYELGNSTSFDLNSSKFDQEIYNNILNVEVKASPSKYAYAYTESAYAGIGESEYKIYQMSPVENVQIKGGILSYDKHNVNKTVVSMQTKPIAELSLEEKVVLFAGENLPGGQVLQNNFSGSVCDLNGLGTSYTGKRMYAYVLSTVDDNIKAEYGNRVNYFNSINCIAFDVVPNIEIAIKDYLVSWTSVKNVSSYKVLIDNFTKATVTDSSFNLSTLPDVDNLGGKGILHTLKIEPQITEDNLNIVKTNAEYGVMFDRLAPVEISVNTSGIEWTEVENANTYYLHSSKDNEILPLKTTEFSLSEYPAGEYTFTISSSNLGNHVDGVYYLPSHTNDVTVTKQETANAVVEDYKLKIKDAQIGEMFLVEFPISEGNNYSQIEAAKDVEIEIDLAGYEFSAGNHTIVVTRLGQARLNQINADPYYESFVQLEKINELTISNSAVTVSKTGYNANADIYLTLESSVLDSPRTIDMNRSTYTFETVDTTKTDECLPAGDYILKVYVKGDGSETFSCREGRNEIATAETSFTVLPAPVVVLNDPSVSKIAYTVGSNDEHSENVQGFKVYSSLAQRPTNESQQEHGFTLNSGSVTFNVQAIGNNSSYLTSCLSDPIEIHRLETPTLVFDNENDINTFAKFDDEDINTDAVNGHKFLFNGVENAYAFDGTTFLDFEEGTNNFSLITLAKAGKVSGVYYLDSLAYQLNIGQISNNVDFSIDSNNVLNIRATEHAERYNVTLIVKVNGIERTFEKISDSVLSDGTINLNYTYSAKTYRIPLVDAEHNEIILGIVENGLTVKTKFAKTSQEQDTIRNGTYSEESVLALNIIDATSDISVNANNQLVIDPTNHEQAYYLRLYLSNADTNITLKQTSSNVLSGDGYSLSFVKTGGAYIIDLLNNDFSFKIDSITTDFKVKVSYSHNSVGGATDTDSGYSSLVDIQFADAVEFERDEQTIKLINGNQTYTYNYYNIKINGQERALYTTEFANGIHVLDVDDVYDYYADLLRDGINEIQIVTKNLETTTIPTLSVISESFYFERERLLNVSFSKNNNSNDNSMYIEVETRETPYDNSYEKQYVFYILNNSNMDAKGFRAEMAIRTDDDASAGKISLRLDDFIVANEHFSNVVYITANLETEAYYEYEGKTVYVYSSAGCALQQYNIVDTVSNIRISNDRLTFNAVENAVGYEIYVKNAQNYSETRLNENLLLTNSYQITEITGEIEIVIKSIAEYGYTNSTYSTSINVIKLEDPVIREIGGDFLIEYDSTVNAILTKSFYSVELEINEFIINLKNLPEGIIKYSENSIIIPAEALLQYAATTIMAEKITVRTIVECQAQEEQYFLNSNAVEKDAYGVFGPNNIKKAPSLVQDGAEYVENIIWNASANNILLGDKISVAYEMEIIYALGEDAYLFSSRDPNLKYRGAAGQLQSYGAIKENSAMFPVGYDKDNDGVLDIEFKHGWYAVRIRARAEMEFEEYELYASRWSTPYEFTILTAPTLYTYDGGIEWDKQEGADYYLVTLTQNGQKILSNPEDVRTNRYDFSNTQLENVQGLIQITVKAVSSDEHILSSVASEEYTVYRMPAAKDVILDDGDIVLEAVPYFTRADIVFVSTRKTQTIPIDNAANSETFLKNLGINDWSGLADIDESTLTQTVRFKLSGEELNILAGYSYTITVTLYGSTSETLGIVNSATKKVLGDIKPTKILPASFKVNAGKLTFDANGETYQDVKFNYNFNNLEGLETFWQNAIIYKITIRYNLGTYTIYALDYNSFLKLKTIDDAPSYSEINGMGDLCGSVKMGDLYLNVYKDNTINFATHTSIYYYPITYVERYVDNELEYFFEGEDAVESITLDKDGSIFVNVYMLGGDGYEIEDGQGGVLKTGYITAQTANINQFVKYAINSLTSKDGKVQVENKVQRSIENKDQIIDYPVYRFEISKVGEENKVTLVYLYTNVNGDGLEIAQYLASRDAESRKGKAVDYEVVEVKYAEAEGKVLTDTHLLYNMSPDFTSGNYNVKVRTLSGLGVEGVTEGAYWLDALQDSENKIYKKYGESPFSVNDKGTLTLTLGYFTNDWTRTFSKSHEITISAQDGGEEFTYIIDDRDENVEIIEEKDHLDEKIYRYVYVMPTVISYKGTEYVLEDGGKYQIKARAIDDIEYALQGTYGTVFKFEKMKKVSSLEVVEGQLRWVVQDVNNYQHLVLNITQGEMFIVNRVAGIEVRDDNGKYLYHYSNLEGIVEIGKEYDGKNKPKTYLDAGEYSIKAYVAGIYNNSDNYMVDSLFTETITVERLQSVSRDSIHTYDGILKWQAVEGAEMYEINIVDENWGTEYKYIKTTNSLAVEDDATVDGKFLPVGEYKIEIRTLGNSYLTSLSKGWVEGFEKMNSITGIKLKEDKYGDYVVWDKQSSAQGYKVRFIYTNLSGVATEVDTIIDSNETTSIEVPKDIQGTFTVMVNAIGIGEGKVFNSEWSSLRTNVDSPLPVGSVMFDYETYTYSWVVEEDFSDDDTLVLEYDFEQYANNGVYASVREEKTIEEYRGDRTYSFKLTEIGRYSNFSVRVARANTASSAKMTYYSEEDNGVVVFDIYAYGQGTSTIPYVITAATHLLNIKYNPGAYFVLGGKIDISSVYTQEQLSSANALICNKFYGTLDGTANKFAITFAGSAFKTISLQNVTNLALFNTVERATIKNISIGENNVEVEITNTFSKSVTEELKFALLANNNVSSAIDNVEIKNITLILKPESSSIELLGGFKIAAMFATSEKGSINNSSVKGFKVSLNMAVAGYTYIASLIAYNGGNYVTATTVAYVESEFELNSTLKEPSKLTSVGGLVAYMASQSGYSSSVENVTVTVNISGVKALYNGGLIGHARAANVISCKVYGEMNISLNGGEQTYIGGILGKSYNSNITTATIGAVLNIATSDLAGQQFIGVLVGNAEASTDTTCSITNCYAPYGSSYKGNTYMSGGTLVLGVYGSITGNVSIPKDVLTYKN